MYDKRFTKKAENALSAVYFNVSFKKLLAISGHLATSLSTKEVSPSFIAVSSAKAIP